MLSVIKPVMNTMVPNGPTQHMFLNSAKSSQVAFLHNMKHSSQFSRVFIIYIENISISSIIVRFK